MPPPPPDRRQRPEVPRPDGAYRLSRPAAESVPAPESPGDTTLESPPGPNRSLSPKPAELAPGPIGSARGEALDAVRRADSRWPAPIVAEPAEPPTSLRSGLQDAFPWLRTPKGRLALWAVGIFVTGGGATIFRGPLRDWAEVPSRAEWRAADDAKAASIAAHEERIAKLEVREAARATEEERRRADEKLRVLEEQNRALQDEVRRAYKRNPDRAPVVMMPAEP